MRKHGWWIAFAVVPMGLVAGRSARAEVGAAVDQSSDDSLVWVDDCPFDARRPHAMRCLSRRRVPRAVAEARRIGPFTAPPDAGEGVDASSDIATCDGQVLTGGGGTPSGLAPSDYIKAYSIPATPGGTGKIIAIVDACANTTVVSDLAAYRAQYGLPALPECGGADGNAPTPGATACFGVVSQRGDGALPTPDSGWAGEIALDVEMASVGCPECSIVLVEADTPNSWDLGPAVNEAVSLGASAISNSYGSPEDPNDPFGPAYSDGPYATYFQHDGVLITVASGDSAYNDQLPEPGQTTPVVLAPSFPSTVPSVLSVGGTTLKASTTTTRGYNEALWKDSTSGCSGEFAKPAYQADVAMGSCTMRGDVNLAAPASNVSTYAGGGWGRVGGTSCASPFVASLFTHLGLANQPNAFFYSHPEAFFDVTSGNNDPSHACTDVMCNAGVGWDGPTGWGSPNAAVLSTLLDDGGTGATDGGNGGDAGSTADAGSSGDSGQAIDAGSGQDATVPDDAGGAADANVGSDATIGADASGGQDASNGEDSSTVASNDASTSDDAGSGPGTSGDGGTISLLPDAATDEDGGGNGAAGSASGCGCETVGSRSPARAPAGLALLALGSLVAITRRRRG